MVDGSGLKALFVDRHANTHSRLDARAMQQLVLAAARYCSGCIYIDPVFYMEVKP